MHSNLVSIISIVKRLLRGNNIFGIFCLFFLSYIVYFLYFNCMAMITHINTHHTQLQWIWIHPAKENVGMNVKLYGKNEMMNEAKAKITNKRIKNKSKILNNTKQKWSHWIYLYRNKEIHYGSAFVRKEK